MRSLLAATFGAATLISLSIAPLRAHEGHVHGDENPVATSVSATARGEAASTDFELVAIADGKELILYLDRFATNEPVEGASIEVETPQGSVSAIVRDGGYRVAAPWLDKPGPVDLIFTVAAATGSDILPMTFTVPAPSAAVAQHRYAPRFAAIAAGVGLVVLLVIAMALWRRPRRAVAGLLLAALLVSASAPAFAHDGEDHGDHNQRPVAQASGNLAQRLPDGSVFVPKPAQRIFDVRTTLAEIGTHKITTELPGRIIPDPNASGLVQSSVGGRLSAPPGGFPRLGTVVKQGDVLAYITPPLQAIDLSDMRQRQGELDQQISIVERRLARFESLVPSGAVARSQLEDTRSELQGLKQRRGSLDSSRREPEALVAPVSGVIADGNAVAGQIVAPSAIVFHIIDPAKLWVEALSFAAVQDAQAASASTAAGKTFALSYRGAGYTDRSQSIPVHFAIDGNLSGLRAGQFVTVLVNSRDESSGIAVPRASVVRSANGQDIVYEHKKAESFIPRPVRVEPLDGDRVLVVTGLEPGMRIVTRGAELLDHVR